jgi:hypothetical protein
MTQLRRQLLSNGHANQSAGFLDNRRYLLGDMPSCCAEFRRVIGLLHANLTNSLPAIRGLWFAPLRSDEIENEFQFC